MKIYLVVLKEGNCLEIEEAFLNKDNAEECKNSLNSKFNFGYKIKELVVNE